MKTLAQHVYAMVAVGGVLLVSGCATTDPTSTGPRFGSSRQVGPTNEFTVIESSFGRELSAQEMSLLRDGVAKYLVSQGVAPTGEYYVRVNFPPAQPEGTGDWVVVRVASLPASTYTLIAAYPAIGPDDYYPYAFAYNQGYGYGGFDYGYYDSPVYYPTNYHPRPNPGTTHWRDRDNKPGDRRRDGEDRTGDRWRDGDGKPGDHRRDGDSKPGDRWTGNKDEHPRGVTPTRKDGPRDRTDGTPNRNYRPDNPRYTPRPDRAGGSSEPRALPPRPSSSDSGGSRSYSPPASSHSSGNSSYSAPPAPASAPVSQPSSSGSSRGDDRRQQD